VQICTDFNFFDDFFNKQDLSQIFDDANVEYNDDEDDNNPDDLLNRKEFLEIMMRICLKKYHAPLG